MFAQCHSSCFFFFTGGTGKHRPKEPKKKNKQRLRFRAQNQHSDHLASARSSQWGPNLPTSHWRKKEENYNAKLLVAAAATIFWLTGTVLNPSNHTCPPGHSYTISIKVIMYNISIGTLYTCFTPPAACPLAVISLGSSKPRPMHRLVDIFTSWTHFPSLTVLLSCALMEDEGATKDCGGGRAEWTDG